MSKMIYLDNNATTIMPSCVMKEMLRWCNMGNPSSEYTTAKESQKMFEEFRKYICGCVCGGTASVGGTASLNKNTDEYEIIFTSGASEGNSTLIRSVVNSTSKIMKEIPHVVASAVEHKSILNCLEALENDGKITYTLVRPQIDGTIHPADIEYCIQSNTVLVICMHANNETGAINDIASIGKIAHSRNVPFHCDTVQTFGKIKVDSVVDSFVVSFHKMYGPPGCGVLGIRKKFKTGYKLGGIISGTQNGGFRGGTENLPGIGASFAAIKYAHKMREEKNKKLSVLKSMIIKGMSDILPVRTYESYVNFEGPPCEIVLIGGGVSGSANSLPNTILFAVIKQNPTGEESEYVCNRKIKNTLEKNGIIISVGSACNTASEKASHVLYSMQADIYIRKGTLRLSLSDHNTVEHVKKFLECFRKSLIAQNIKCVV